jgi:excisionase family DNA binding protein
VRQIVREELGARGAPEVLSTEQAAELAGVSAKTVRAWISDGLPAGRRGRLRTIRRADLERWLAGERPKGDALLRSIG